MSQPEEQKKKADSAEGVNYARWIVLLLTAKAVIILVAVAIILAFKGLLG